MDKKYILIGGGIVFLIVILGAVLVMGGGGGPTVIKKQGELVWWKTFEDSANLSEVISEYQELNEGVTIKYVKKDIVTYEQELVDALAAGKGPDIATIHNDWLPKHMDKLSPMPEGLVSLRTYKETFVDVVADDFVKDNKIYAVPLSIDVLALYFNKDILGSAGIATPPKTWPELVSDVEKITKQSVPGNFSKSGVALGTSNNVNRAVDILLLLMLQNGTQFYSSNFSSASFDQSAVTGGGNYNPGEKALEFYTQFANPAKKSYTWNNKSDFSIDSFAQGKLGLMLSFYYVQPTIKARSPNLSWGVVASPQVDTSSNKVNFANYWGEAVSKASKNSGLAWDFLNFITQKESLIKYYAKHKLPSARKDILSQQQSDEELGVFAESALTAKSVYKKDPSVFEGVFLKMIDDVILRNFTPPEAVRSAVSQINLSLQK